MSSIVILQERDKFTYFVDTAQSLVIDDTIYRVKGMNAQKTHQIAKDIVFLSGNSSDLDIILNILPDMVDENGHIKADELQTFLRLNFSPIDDINSKKINGLVILSIVNGKTLMVAMKQSYEHFKIISSGPPASGINIYTDGFNNVEIGQAILKRNKKNIETIGKSYIDTDIFDTYKELYSEGVGGEIRMYLFDTSGVELLRTEELIETGLRHLDKGVNVLPSGEYITIHFINGGVPINSLNIGAQSVGFATNAGNATSANYATNAGSVSYASSAGSAGSLYRGGSGGSVYVSINNNFRPTNDAEDNDWSSCGTAEGRWSSVWALNGSIITSDEREKFDISRLDEDDRFIKFAKMIAPYTFKMINGTSGREHIGFIAQRIEEAMTECGISDMEFAGLVKAPVYAEKLKDKDGNELNEYDTTSEIIDYTYHLRYEEFIPLLFLWLGSLDNEAAAPPESL